MKIYICIPSFNEAKTIESITKLVDQGLQSISLIYGKSVDAKIINIDSSSEDKTVEIFNNVNTIFPKQSIILEKPRGKGKNLLAFIKIAYCEKADFCLTIDADIYSANSSWIGKLLGPILNNQADFVTPLYARSRFEGSSTNHFAYPIVLALTGINVRQPIAGDFAFNSSLLTILTIILLAGLSVILFRNLKRESDQRVQIAKLNIDLQKSIKARESLTHLVTHKVKGYFTRTKCVFAEMIEGSFGILPPKAKEMAAGGLASDNEGIAMVDMVLNQASLQAGLIKYDMKPFDFKGIVKEVIEEKRGPAEKKGLKMETDIKDEDYTITGDQRWLKEAILNLVDNAVKCTEKGKITVGLGLKEKQVLFYVKDTGRGITPEDRKNLYTEGGRGKDSLKYNPDSTGYGLATVKLIVEAHQGKVWEDTEVGKGNIFHLKPCILALFKMKLFFSVQKPNFFVPFFPLNQKTAHG